MLNCVYHVRLSILLESLIQFSRAAALARLPHLVSGALKFSLREIIKTCWNLPPSLEGDPDPTLGAEPGHDPLIAGMVSDDLYRSHKQRFQWDAQPLYV